MIIHKAIAKPPVWTILDVGEVTTKVQLRAINTVLQRLGSECFVRFTKDENTRDGFPAGKAYYSGPRRQPVLIKSRYLAIHPDGSIRQIDTLDHYDVFKTKDEIFNTDN